MTPTPTPGPWATLTPEPTHILENPPLVLPTGISYTLAEQIVAGYNRYEVTSYAEFIIIVMLIIGGVLSIIYRLRKI